MKSAPLASALMASVRLCVEIPIISLAASLLTGALLGCAQPGAVDPPTEIDRPARMYPIQEFLGSTGFTGASFSPDASKLLVSSDQTGIFNAYAIPIASPIGI